MQKIHFGTDGWRAVISDDFTFENVKIVAQSMADYVKIQKAKINKRTSELYGRRFALVIGYDTRFFSEKYAELIACVMAANGIKVILADRPTPTPSVSFYIRRKKLVGGVMITASHNPAPYNGIKFKAYFGGSAGKRVTDFMESRLYKTKVRFVDKKDAVKKGLIKIEDIVSVHIRYVRKYARMRFLKKSKLKILVDSMNGTGGYYIEDILRGTNNAVKTINGDRDPYFGGRSPEPNDVHLKSTAEIVKKGKYDVAFATDGDADRLGVILPNGEVLSGHKVMTLLLLHFLEDRHLKGGVVQTICGTELINRISKRYRLKTYETPVGFKYIAEIINKHDILLGGEETGGVAFKGWLAERDGILSGLLILEMMGMRKKKLQDIVKSINKTYGTYIYKRVDLRYSRTKKKKLLAVLKKKPFDRAFGKKIIDTKSYDGFKFILEDGAWFMLRPSGTEPKLRIYSEAHSEKEALKLVEFGKKFALRI